MAGPSANPGVGAHNASSARTAAVKPIVILIDGASNHPTRTRRLQIATPGRLARSAQAVDLLAGRWRIHSPPARGVVRRAGGGGTPPPRAGAPPFVRGEAGGNGGSGARPPPIRSG